MYTTGETGSKRRIEMKISLQFNRMTKAFCPQSLPFNISNSSVSPFLLHVYSRVQRNKPSALSPH